MQWRNREKRNDQEHHVKASFFHLTDKIFFFTSCCLLCYLFLKKCLLHFLLLVMLFAHVAKRSNSRSQIFFKTDALKILQYCIHRKTLVLEPLFNKVSGLKASIFINKGALTQLFFCEYCEIFKNSFFIEDLFIIPFRNFI